MHHGHDSVNLSQLASQVWKSERMSPRDAFAALGITVATGGLGPVLVFAPSKPCSFDLQ